MLGQFWLGKVATCAIALLLICSSLTFAQAKSPPAAEGEAPQARRAFKIVPLADLPEEARNHPLVPALRFAETTLRDIRANVRDYTCRMARRERIDGRLRDHEFIDMKVRHEQLQVDKVTVPFSVYLKYAGPARYKDREVLYVAGQNDGEMLARNGGNGNLKNVTISLRPLSPRAMRFSRYPITDVGFENLAIKLLEVGNDALQHDLERRECSVRTIKGAKIEGRGCWCIQVKFPIRREHSLFHIARIFIDDEQRMPVRFASYSWPQESGQRPILMEEYTYMNVKLNVGLTDRDFSRDNPTYGFHRPQPAADTTSRTVKTGE